MTFKNDAALATQADSIIFPNKPLILYLKTFPLHL